MQRFTLVTGLMVVLLGLGLAFGGLWSVLALVYITLFTVCMDRISGLAASDHPGEAIPTGDALSIALGLVHFVLLYVGVRVLASGDASGVVDKILIFIALSLFVGQVGNANAHELIHRSNRWMRRLGVAVYSSILFGHHASAHVRVHHVHAATERDPNSARLGETYYAFALRAWTGALIEGFRAELRLRKGTGLHPYVGYAAGAALSLALAFALGGFAGVAVLLAISAYAQAQLLLSDYVQHYGLRRRETAPGKCEPVGPQHSWNSPHPFSSALMLNAPRHSDHHAHPARPYPALDLDRATMPILPHPLPVMATLALVPPVWRRLMDRRAARWAEARQA